MNEAVAEGSKLLLERTRGLATGYCIVLGGPPCRPLESRAGKPDGPVGIPGQGLAAVGGEKWRERTLLPGRSL